MDQEGGHDLVPEPEEGRDLLPEYDARPDLFTPPQQVTLQIGDQDVGTFTADQDRRRS